MIRFESVSKDYGDLKALDTISFTVEPGGIVGLLGPNGAGKTTTMRIMTGYLAASAGSVTFDGEPFTPHRTDLKRHIGYLPESAPAYSDMLAWDYLVWEARLHGLPWRQRVPEVIQMVGLGSHAHKPIRQLSKGFRQRVGLAHTLLHDPRILVLDEPTSGLDPNQILEVRDLIRRIARTKTVVLSTHIMQEVEALCDRVVVIHRGQIRYDGTISAFSGSAAGQQQRVRVQVAGISSEDLHRHLAALPGVVAVEPVETTTFRDGAEAVATGAALDPGTTPATGAALDPGTTPAPNPQAHSDLRSAIFHMACDHRLELREMTAERTSLEQVFQELTDA